MNLFSLFLLSLYALAALCVSCGITLYVQSTLDRARGYPTTAPSWGVFLRLTGIALLCFLVLKYKHDHLFLGIIVFFSVSILVLLYFFLVMRASIR